MHINMNPVGWFEIPVTDMDRAQAFYEAVFNFQLKRMEMGPNLMAWFPFEEGAPQSTGTLVKGEAYTPSEDGTIVYFTATDFDETLERVEANGGKVIFPKTDIGEHGWIAHVGDTEGNRIAIHRRK